MPGFRFRIALVVGALFSGHAALAEPVVTGTGAAADPIVIVLDAPVSGSLAVEIDGVDMTGLIQQNGNTLTIAPVPPLSPGDHEVILYSVQGDSFEIVVEWLVDDGRSSIVDSVSVVAIHEAGVRQNNVETTASAESAGDLEIVMFDQRMKAGANYIATTIEENQIDGRPINLGEYYLEFTQPTDAMDITARLGHQNVDYDELVVADLYKRGAGLSFDRLDQRARLAFFGTQAGDGVGIDNFTGLGDTDDLVFGATVAVQPFASTDATLSVTGYSGRGEEFDGLGVTGEGDAYGLSLSGSVRDGRIRYGLGAAQSRWDEDGGGAAFQPVEARAYSASIEYDAIVDDGFSDAGRSLTFGLSYTRVDHEFFSLANPLLNPSQETISLSADYANDKWFLNAILDHQTTNVNGPDDLETDRIVTASVYGTRYLFIDGAGPGWVGLDPTLNFNIDFTTQDRLDTPLLAPLPLDQTSVLLGADFATSYETWSWSLGYALDWYNDESASDDDSLGHGLTFGVDLFPTERLSFGVAGDILAVSDTFSDYIDGSVTFDASYDIMPATLVLAGQYQLDYSTDSFGLNGGTLGADITWAISEASELELSAGMSHGDNAVFDDTDWFVGALLRFNTNYVR